MSAHLLWSTAPAFAPVQFMRAKSKPPGGFDLSPDILAGQESRGRIRTRHGTASEPTVKYAG
jgi:hypothetical protein